MLVGVDFTNTAIRAGVVSGGQVLRSNAVDTPAGATPARFLDAIARVVSELGDAPSTVGIAIPGEVNSDGRCWRLPNIAGFEGVRIAEEIARRLHCPVAVENRATAAALAEQLYGHGQRHQTFLLVSLDTGIGGGLVVGQGLYPGANGFGAEIGHLCIDTAADAPRCGCGQRGCVEAFAGTRAVARRFAELGGGTTDFAGVVASARRGEWSGVLAFESMGRALGRALSTVQNVLDLGAVVFSGPAAAEFDLFEASVHQELGRQVFAPPLSELPLLVSALGDTAAVIGAAHLATL